MKSFILLIIIISISGCQSGLNSFTPATLIDARFTVQKQTPTLALTYCQIYELNSSKMTDLAARLCFVYGDGSLLRFRENQLTKFDSEKKVLWRQQDLNLRYQLSASKDGSEILSVNQEFWKDEKDNCLIGDSLVVFDNAGNLLKKFSVLKFLQSLPLNRRIAIHPGQSYQCGSVSVDLTQVKTFSEYDFGGAERRRGYVAFDNQNNMTLLLDSDLNVVKFHIEHQRNLKAIAQIGKNEILYYEAVQNGNSAGKPTAQLVIYDISTNTYSNFYTSQVDIESHKDCGSVSLINSEEIFLGHSPCFTDPKAKKFVVELINLKSGTVRIFQVNSQFTPSIVNPFFYSSLIKLK